MKTEISNLEMTELKIAGLKLIKPRIFRDERGYFLESFRQDFYQALGLPAFIQDNHAFSSKNTLRGMHFQKDIGQDKLVSVVKGEIFDVVVDIRKESNTFGKWAGFILDDIKCHQLFIPKGFAHGFCVISEDAHVCYKVSNYFQLDLEVGFNCLDKIVNISWPTKSPIFSLRDLETNSFEEAKKWF